MNRTIRDCLSLFLKLTLCCFVLSACKPPDDSSVFLPPNGDGTSTALAPILSSVMPSAGPPAGGTLVTLSGTYFDSTADVLIDTTACLDVNIVSTTEITCVTPAHDPGPVNITIIQSGNSTVTLADAFTYQAGPSIVSVSPSAGALNGGTTIVISGSGFDFRASITLGGTPCSAVLFSETQLTCTTPPHAAGTVDVAVTNPSGQSVLLSGGYTFESAPEIDSISPTTGPVAGGTSLTISGNQLLASATVLIGGYPCSSIQVTPPHTIECTSPLHSPGPADVEVTNQDGQTGILPGGFTYIKCTHSHKYFAKRWTYRRRNSCLRLRDRIYFRRHSVYWGRRLRLYFRGVLNANHLHDHPAHGRDARCTIGKRRRTNRVAHRSVLVSRGPKYNFDHAHSRINRWQHNDYDHRYRLCHRSWRSIGRSVLRLTASVIDSNHLCCPGSLSRNSKPRHYQYRR